MSVAASERGLFAVKGRAAPIGLEPPNKGPDALDEPAAAQNREEAAAAPESRHEGGHQEALCGSLLTFRLRGEAGRSALSAELKAALAPSGPESRPAATAEPARAPAAPAESVTQQVISPAPTAPVAVETPRVSAAARLDRPLFPQARRERDAVLAARTPPVSHDLPRNSAWRIGLPLGAAVAAIAAVGWLVSQSSSMPATESSPPADILALAANAEAEAEADWAVPIAAGLSAPSAPPSGADAGALPAPAVSEVPSAAAALPADAPTFDIVRVSSDAPAVLAGRAARGSQLIVLDNGEAIGTATADENGEWTLVTDAPLPAGRHELVLALATPEGAVVIEQADTQAEPAADEDNALLTPPLKPVQKDVRPQAFAVQLASVPSAADAEREWARLQKAYPDQLGGATVDIAAVEIGGRGTFYRLRTGSSLDRQAARQLCGALRAAGQECLVVRQTSGEE